jgi:hypothetical protein
MNKVKVGFFSFVEITDPSAHRSYNEWHQLDHLPEQFPIPGIAYGQRWVSTPACRAARAACSDELDPVHYLALYLLTEPVRETIREFEALGNRLGEQGRFHRQRRSLLFGAWHLLESWAAPRVLISAEAVPYRPCKGIYVVAEEAPDSAEVDAWVRWCHTDWTPALGDVDGVVGAWSFATSPLYRSERWVQGRSRITVCWLDRDPLEVASSLRPALDRRWDGAPVRPLYAGPLETITPWEWSWFGE